MKRVVREVVKVTLVERWLVEPVVEEAPHISTVPEVSQVSEVSKQAKRRKRRRKTSNVKRRDS